MESSVPGIIHSPGFRFSPLAGIRLVESREKFYHLYPQAGSFSPLAGIRLVERENKK